ncbi:hypothetical protein AB0B78_22765 [Streptomyces sp. NPDC040724]|uniref:hypothetical protein n=1 Tax=Streptomyces sp. NPDC040724 TaxID=3155612 RepID=UPI0033FA2F2D
MPPGISEAQAKEVFERYVRENSAADESGDTEAIARVEGGLLLEESRAEARLHQAQGSKDEPVRYVRPVYLIPRAAQGAPAPRGFAVLSKKEGYETDRSSVLHCFTRGEDSEAWKAVVATWVGTEAPPQDATAAPAPSPEQDKVKTQPKVLPPLGRHRGGVECDGGRGGSAGRRPRDGALHRRLRGDEALGEGGGVEVGPAQASGGTRTPLRVAPVG